MLEDADGSEETLAKAHLIILVHGIRDNARWQANVRPALEAAGYIVQPTNYGRMNLLEFLLPPEIFRKISANKVLTQIRHARQLNPQAELSVIARSFGTYVVSRLLRRQFDLKLRRVIFCGSVVRYDFPFEQVQERFMAPVLNEVGTSDPWPAIAEAVTTGYGSAGTYGFNRTGVRDRYHNDAGHGHFLNPEFVTKYWVPFLETGEVVPGSEPAKEPPLWVRFISIFKIKYLIFFAGICFALLKGTQIAAGERKAMTYAFGGRPYVYWNDPVRLMLAAIREPCSITPQSLCMNALAIATLRKREFIPMQEEDERVRQIVSCRTFTIQAVDPNVALQELARAFPACLSLQRDRLGWVVRIRVEGVSRVERRGDVMCGFQGKRETEFLWCFRHV